MPAFYKMPWLGQPFKLEQNEQVVEYASVDGVRVTGEYVDANGETQKSWTAVISSPISHAFRFYHNTEVGNWKPLSAEEMAALRGAAAMGDVVDKATFLALVEKCATLEARLVTISGIHDDRITLLEAKLLEVVSKGKFDDGVPVAKPLTPPSPQVNGARPSRVAQ